MHELLFDRIPVTFALQQPSEAFRVHGVDRRLDINEKRTCPQIDDCTGRRKECVGDGDHSISRSDTYSFERQQKSISTRRYGYRVRDLQEPGDLYLESCDLRTKNESLTFENFLDRRANFLPDRRILCLQVH